MMPELTMDWIYWFMVTFMVLLILVVAAASGDGNMFQSKTVHSKHYHYGEKPND